MGIIKKNPKTYRPIYRETRFSFPFFQIGGRGDQVACEGVVIPLRYPLHTPLCRPPDNPRAYIAYLSFSKIQVLRGVIVVDRIALSIYPRGFL